MAFPQFSLAPLNRMFHFFSHESFCLFGDNQCHWSFTFLSNLLLSLVSVTWSRLSYILIFHWWDMSMNRCACTWKEAKWVKKFWLYSSSAPQRSSLLPKLYLQGRYCDLGRSVIGSHWWPLPCFCTKWPSFDWRYLCVVRWEITWYVCVDFPFCCIIN